MRDFRTGGLVHCVFPAALAVVGGPRQLIAWGSGGGELRATQSYLNNFRKYLHSNILFSVSVLLRVAPCCSSKWEELKALTYEALTWQAVSAVAAAHVRLAHGPWAALCASYSHCHNNLWHCCSSPGIPFPPLSHLSLFPWQACQAAAEDNCGRYLNSYCC